MVEHPGFDAVMYIDYNAVPMVKYRRVDGILEELQQDGHIDNCPKYGVALVRSLVSSILIVC